MNRLWNSVLELFALLRRMGAEEYRGIRNTLLYLLLTFYGLCFLQLIMDGGWIVKTAGFILWLGSVLLLFRVPSLLRIAGLGEILELVRATPQVPDAEKNQIPGVIENQLSVLVWNMTEKIFFLFSTCCLLVPVFPIRNNPWIIVIFTITATVVFLFIWRTGGNWVRPVGLITSLVFLTINVFFSFPQLSYYTGLEKWRGGIVSAKTADTANEIEKLRGKQRDKNIHDTYQKGLNWQKNNPGRDLPESLKKEIEAAKLGLTVSEYDVKIKAEVDAKAKAEKEKAEADAKAKINGASGAPIEIWKLCWKKPDGYNGVSDQKILCGMAEVRKDGKILVMKFHPEKTQNPSIFRGVSLDGKKYQGIWEDRFYSGEFTLDFLSGNSAVGYCTDKGSTVKKDVLMTKN